MNSYNLLPVEEYVKIVKRPYPPLLITQISYGQAFPEYFDHFIKGWPYVHQLLLVNDSDIYYVKEDIRLLGERMMECFKDEKAFKEAIQKFEDQEQKLLDATGSTYDQYVTEYQKYTPALQILAVGDMPKERIEKILLQKVNPEEVHRMTDLLNIPLRDNVHKIEVRELVNTNDLEAHVAKYKYMGARYGTRLGYTVEDAQKKKSEISIEKFLQEDQEEKNKLHENLNKVKELLGEEATLADVMQWVVYYRTQRTDILNRSSFDAYDLYVKKAEELGLTYDELLMCTTQEIAEGNIPSASERAARKQGYSMLGNEKNSPIYTGADNAEILEYFSITLDGATEIKGQTACKGVVQGRAKIIVQKSELGKLEEGDVLVASMTTPDMISAMGKAVAFVTDEGGITCHAAIISREMKKPCIIGTKHATQALHDGDLVEVDADKGVVRILERA
jgi:phosphohistidine swiveling domain-containing protein